MWSAQSHDFGGGANAGFFVFGSGGGQCSMFPNPFDGRPANSRVG
jgi:hypothetical protein